MSHRWILAFTHALGRALCSGGALSFCTCAQPAPGSGCGCLSSTPAQSQKHFTTRQLNASFHHRKEVSVVNQPPFLPPTPLCQGARFALNPLHLQVTLGGLFFYHLSLPLASIISGLGDFFFIIFFLSTAPVAVWKLAGRQLLFSPSHDQMKPPHTVHPPSVQNKALLWKANLDCQMRHLRVAAGTRFSKPPS